VLHLLLTIWPMAEREQFEQGFHVQLEKKNAQSRENEEERIPEFLRLLCDLPRVVAVGALSRSSPNISQLHDVAVDALVAASRALHG
jgi:hypothetical protein